MKYYIYGLAIAALLVAACSGQKDTDRDYAGPVVSDKADTTTSSNALPEKLPIDPGDVDSGILINGMLAPESQSDTVTAEYMETQRDTLSMTTITVRPPFPDALSVMFVIVSTRDFVERPVVMRTRTYRDDEIIGDEQGYVLGKNARILPETDPDAAPPRMFVVNVLEGLTEIPDTMLLHARADAWLMPVGTDETTLNPLTDTAPDRVSLMSNPVRINFIKEEAAP